MEQQYLDLMRKIITTGEKKSNRTGTDTISVFGNTMSFNLSDGVLPLLTTKRMFYRAIVEELLWFLNGCTDATILDSKGIKIWNANSSRECLDKLGFTQRRAGDCGPIYGFQWRHFGAKYVDCDTDYTGLGVDQISQLIEGIRNNPQSRRHIISAWNPIDLNQMVLPPCHLSMQINVSPNAELDCLVYQRSADVPLGVPFNIASYATLTHMIAQQVEMTARNLVYVTGDTHIYVNQINGCREQLSRDPFGPPTLSIKPAKDIFSYQWSDFEVRDYRYHSKINFPFAT